MIRSLLTYFLIFLSTKSTVDALTFANKIEAGRSLVFLAATTPDDEYYGSFYEDIRDFQINYAKNVSAAGDNIIVLVDESVADDYLKYLSPDMILVEPMIDIWIRDYSTVRVNQPAMLSYRNKYLTPELSAEIQNAYKTMLTTRCPAEATFEHSKLFMDGGNNVDNYVDTTILSRRTVKDNPGKTEAQVRTELENTLDYDYVVFIPDSGDTTGHSDGMVSFLDTNLLAISTTLRDEQTDAGISLYDATLNDLDSQANEKLEVIDLDSVYVDDNFDQGGLTFSSACGLHVNALLTQKNLIVPVFGADPVNADKFGQSVDRDEKVLKSIRDALAAAGSDRNVVPVLAPNKVCRMGGSVRCLSTAIQGALADCMVRSAQSDANARAQPTATTTESYVSVFDALFDTYYY